MRSVLFSITFFCITHQLYSVPVNITADLCMQHDSGSRQCGDMEGSCVDFKQFCDGVTDCPNGFDEQSCQNELPTLEEFLEMEYLFCKQDEFKCSNGLCIPLSLVCNGKADCKKGDDENGLCGQCEDFGCGNKCQDFPQGAQCVCPSNMFLSIDGKTCEHHNMCNIGEHQCSQHCSQVQNRVICSCSNGYSLANQFECMVNEEHRNGQIFITFNDNSIHSVELFSNSTVFEEVIPAMATVKEISSISFNQPQQLLYFVGNENHRSSNIFVYNGVTNKNLYFGFGIKHIAVDWITNNIYYAANGLGIGVCSSDGRYCSHLLVGHIAVQNEHFQTYSDLLLHPRRGIIIWIDYNAEHPNGAIMAIGMDGKRPRIIVSMSSKRLRSIAIDYVRDFLYYLEGEELQVIDLKTLEKKRVSSSIHPFSMISFDNNLYFVNRESKNFIKHNENDDHVVYQMLNGNDFSMTVNNSLYYDKFSNPCDEMKCSHLCVLKESVHDDFPLAKCICPDKYSSTLDGDCILDRDVDGPVRTSSAYMNTMCANNLACFNGGVCKGGIEDGDTTPYCDCIRGFNGLYCERYMPGEYDEGSSWLIIFVMTFLLLSIAVAVAIFLLKIYPDNKPKFESFANINAISSSERIQQPLLSTPNLTPGVNRSEPLLLSC